MAGPVTSDSVVLVLGASKALGQCFLRRVGEGSGLQLLAVSRHLPERIAAGVTWLQHDLAEQPVPVMATALVSFGPVGLALRQLEATPSVGRVIAVSSASTEFKSDSGDRLERAQMAMIRSDEADLSELCARRGAGLSLLKATMIYGGDDANVRRLAGLATRLPFIPITGNGLRQPVHADDLASLALRLLAMDRMSFGTWLLGGGETLDYRTMLRRIASAQGRRVRIVGLPTGLLRLALIVANALGSLRDVRPAMLERQAVDLVVDDQPAREQLGWNPRPFRPGVG